MRIAFDWQCSSFFGWGIYSLNLALEWSKDPDIEASGEIRNLVEDIQVDKLRRRALVPFVARSLKRIPSDAIILRNLGNEFRSHNNHEPGGIGVIFFEEPLSDEAIEKAKRYDIIITGSTWNENVLRGHGIEHVKTIFQGVDRSLFHPAPKRNLFPGKFLIFSGGKAEPRKGQDLVVAAFRIFAERHKDAMLVTAWHSPWPKLRDGMDLDLSSVADRVIDIGALPNGQMAPVYRECDVALFPNRAEGGTNLVAMECIACGVPTIVSACTGHEDLLGLSGVMPLSDWQQRPDLWSEWGECSVEEIVEALEVARRTCDPTRQRGGLNDDLFQWSDAASQLADVARTNVTAPRRARPLTIKELAYG
jgi:glycosyltransferase involved in cell wall biosynthesis